MKPPLVSHGKLSEEKLRQGESLANNEGCGLPIEEWKKAGGDQERKQLETVSWRKDQSESKDRKASEEVRRR